MITYKSLFNNSILKQGAGYKTFLLAVYNIIAVDRGSHVNSQDDARPVSGRCNFDRVFRPLP